MADSCSRSEPPGGNLILGDDVYFCVTEGQGIFLDLKRDDYNAIPVALDRANDNEPDLDRAVRQAFELYRQDLVEACLLKEGAGSEDFQAFRSLIRPTSNIFSPDDQRAFGMPAELRKDVRIGVGDLLDFFLAARRASQLLKTRHIQDIVWRVRTRKGSAGQGAGDLDALRRHTAIFRKLRPWYPRSYLCLYDGLALVEFLARRKLFPTWVFGVQAQPFGAHCWVQAGDTLLNEATEYARQFTPIMAI